MFNIPIHTHDDVLRGGYIEVHLLMLQRRTGGLIGSTSGFEPGDLGSVVSLCILFLVAFGSRCLIKEACPASINSMGQTMDHPENNPLA